MGELFEFSVSDIRDIFRIHPVLITSVVCSGAGLYALKMYFGGGVCHSPTLLRGKTAIITGANSGIGRETARDLARRGARVILACRDLTKGERVAANIRREAENDNVLVKVVDLASLASVRKFCGEVLKTEKQVDILVNNAGIMACPQWQSEDKYDLQFAVNHLSHFLLTNLLLERINSTPHARIINVSSLVHQKGEIHWDDINMTMSTNYQPWAAYAQSKLANVLFSHHLHKELQGTTTSTFVVHPGVVRTELTRHIHVDMPRWKRYLSVPVMWFFFKTPWQGAQTSIHCAVHDGLQKHSGKYFSDCRVKEVLPSAKEDDSATRLWELSAKLVGLKH